MKTYYLRSHLDPHLRIEVRERLVEEKHSRFADYCTAQGYALALSTGKRLRQTIQVLRETERLCGVLHTPRYLVLRKAAKLEPERKVLGDGHVRIQRVVLEDHRYVTVLRRQVGDIPAADGYAARGRSLESGDHAKRSGLTAARGSYQHEEFAVAHIERKVRDRRRIAARIDLYDVLEAYFSHLSSPFCSWRISCTPVVLSRSARRCRVPWAHPLCRCMPSRSPNTAHRPCPSHRSAIRSRS